MKKLAIGCAIVALVLVVVGVGASYWVYRKVASTVSQFAELGSVPDLERQVRRQGPYSPPSSGELTADQVQRFAQVQLQVRERLGDRFKEFQEKYRTLLEKKGEATALDMPALISAYRDVAAGWIDAKRAQVDALNQANLSLEEYRWIRREAYSALGVPLMSVDVGKIIEDAKSGRQPTDSPGRVEGSVEPTGPEANRKLVEGVKKQLEDNVALAAFGL